MTIQNWRVFITVCKYNSITKAAQELRIAQPAVSRTIKEIERFYNITLFERTNNRLCVTEFGAELFAKARQAVIAFDSIEEFICGGRNMRVGASIMIGNYIVQDSIEEYKKNAPLTNIELIIDLSTFIEKHIAEGQIDFAFIERCSNLDGLCYFRFEGDPLVALCTKNHPFARYESLSIEDLRDQALFLKKTGHTSRDMFDKEMRKHNILTKPAFESDSTNTVIDMLLQENGVAVLPYLQTRNRCIKDNICRLRLRDVNIRRDYYLVHRSDFCISDMSQDFIDICLNKANSVNNISVNIREGD